MITSLKKIFLPSSFVWFKVSTAILASSRFEGKVCSCSDQFQTWRTAPFARDLIQGKNGPLMGLLDILIQNDKRRGNSTTLIFFYNPIWIVRVSFFAVCCELHRIARTQSATCVISTISSLQSRMSTSTLSTTTSCPSSGIEFSTPSRTIYFKSSPSSCKWCRMKSCRTHSCRTKHACTRLHDFL